jgi:hypothetical protein
MTRTFPLAASKFLTAFTRASIVWVAELEPVVQREPVHQLESTHIKIEGPRHAQDYIVNPGFLNELLAFILGLGIGLLGVWRILLRAYRLCCIRRGTKDHYRRSVDEREMAALLFEQVNQNPGPADIDPPGQLGILISHRRQDAGHMDHRICTFQGLPNRIGLGYVAPNDFRLPTQFLDTLTVLGRVQLEHAYIKSVLEKGFADLKPQPPHAAGDQHSHRVPPFVIV